MIRRFRSLPTGSMYREFLALKQTGTVREYRKKFELLASSLEGISEEVLETTFINGLKVDIGYEVTVFRPNGLEQPMELAQKLPPLTTTIKADEGFRTLSESELQQKRAKILCYKCDENYSPDHRCKKKELQVLLLQDGLEFSNELEKEEDEPKKRDFENQVVEVGATHNFISNVLVNKLQLTLTETTPYGVVLGTGQATKTKGICKGVTLTLQGVEIIEDFLPLDLRSIDLILDIQGLETLGVTHIN
ncbi:hypothetical protein LIER_27497 [Lithospermum erythrorhizon]|uniref:Retrotransposon gag domain-containing protein n=1 Tax=Lithospermum erythrorhizon TaxID=34254 RepID=A0AAV3RFX1_LITER